MTAADQPAPVDDPFLAVGPCPSDAANRSIVLLRATVFSLAVVVAVQAGLGFAGALRAAPAVLMVMAGTIALAATVAQVRRARRDRAIDAHRRSAPAMGSWGVAASAAGVVAIVVALGERLWAGLHRTRFLYDVLSYHLHLPASWRAAGRLTIVPTPFGDPAPAYAPSNAELIYHLGLAVAGNATLAHAGQIPFAALAVLAIYTTARVLGVPRAPAWAAALAFLLLPEVWQQAPTAMTDLALGALFLATIPFLLRLERRRCWPDVAALGATLGLLLGTKFASVVIALPLLLWAAGVLIRRQRGVGALPAIGAVLILFFACGGFWYLRNGLVTGNPLFPATLAIGSWTLAPGLYDSALRLTSEYHLPVTDLQALVEIFLELGWGPLVGFSAGLVAGRRTRWPWLVATMVALCWLVIPYQQSRFFFAAWGLAVITLAAVSLAKPRLGGGALALAAVGAVVQFPTPARLAVLGAATLAAVAVPRALAFASPRVLAFASRYRIPRRQFHLRLAGPAAWLMVVLAAFALVAWARWGSGPVAAYGVGDHHDEGWAWIRRNSPLGRIAYTGSNLPLPLWGAGFENRVRYVNVAGGPDAAAHDFAWMSPAPSSVPLSAEPAPERHMPDRATWLANLDGHQIDLLFVAALYPIVRMTIAHDDDGFPVERAWADQLPARFPLVFSNEGIRIYRHRHRRPGGP